MLVELLQLKAEGHGAAHRRAHCLPADDALKPLGLHEPDPTN